MSSLNKVILMGNLTRDPELRYTPSGSAVCDIGLAMNERYKNRDGEQVEDVVFVDITLWNRQAEIVNEYVVKGNGVIVEGKLKLDQWETEDGKKRSKLKVVGTNVVFLPRSKVLQDDGADAPEYGVKVGSKNDAIDDDDDDMPF